MNNKWTSMNKIAVRVSYGVYILALLFVVVMLFLTDTNSNHMLLVHWWDLYHLQ